MRRRVFGLGASFAVSADGEVVFADEAVLDDFVRAETFEVDLAFARDFTAVAARPAMLVAP
ncbi:MAG: hypothetical protein AAF483_20190 [Planctomycetota bacterium]